MPLIERHFAGCEQHHVFNNQPLHIAHLSDQHVGRATKFSLQQKAIAACAGADLVCLTGDFVAHSLKYLDELEWLLLKLEAPAFAVLGNHDHWADANAVRQTLRRAGVEVLDNANTTISIKGRRLQVIGLDDGVTGHDDVAKAVKGLSAKVPTIGLSHLGEKADALFEHGVPLVLSGHTHAGQISSFNLHRVVAGHLAGHRYVHGLYGERDNNRALYVSAGVGSSIFSLRVGERAQPEVAHFHLGAKASDFDEVLPRERPMRGHSRHSSFNVRKVFRRRSNRAS